MKGSYVSDPNEHVGAGGELTSGPGTVRRQSPSASSSS